MAHQDKLRTAPASDKYKENMQKIINRGESSLEDPTQYEKIVRNGRTTYRKIRK